ncbi:MAG: 3-phosphoshikimate 1-carboxyvinyltransferase [Bacteroidota bacterium]|nr:3-phosphoshikimate 1-carboxyvinyltransferase [Bacteroidota bacterium]
MTHSISPADSFAGRAHLPADKSVAHRAALIAAIADGPSILHNFPSSADPRSTLSCLRQLGVPIETSPDNSVTVHGVGRSGFSAPDAPLDCGNSGTTMRLLSGVLAGQPFCSELIGDASLSSRPMERIARPLRTMGANISLKDGHAPIRIQPCDNLTGIHYKLPVPSAQVKTCVLLAGLWAKGQTILHETIRSRDHTERMLNLTIRSADDGRAIHSDSSCTIPQGTFTLPGDFSAAAFILVAASLAGTAPVHMSGVGLNPSRTGLLDVLRRMGANIQISNRRTSGVEPVGELSVHRNPLHGVTVSGDEIPNVIDEIPIIAVAGAFAKGVTIIRDATELRYKECDRIQATVANLRALGANVEEFEDGLAVTGMVPLHGAKVSSYGDHRIAMAMGVAALGARGTTTIEGAHAAAVSFPEFWDTIAALQA